MVVPLGSTTAWDGGLGGKNLMLVEEGGDDHRFGVRVVWKVAAGGESMLISASPLNGEDMRTCTGQEPLLEQFNRLFPAGTSLRLMDCEDSVKPTGLMDSLSTPDTTTTSTVALPCDAATVSLSINDHGECKKLPDGSERWFASMEPSPDTPAEDLEALGMSLAMRSAKVQKHQGQEVPEDEIPHVMMDEAKHLKLFLESNGSCAQQQMAIKKLFPSGRHMVLHRCKDSDGFFF
ncbi:unnamed protein product [Effrenium voratum]|nr:unnamed protein product [Effrenium voratum]